MTASDIEVWRCGKVGKGRGLAESLPAYLFSILLAFFTSHRRQLSAIFQLQFATALFSLLPLYSYYSPPTRLTPYTSPPSHADTKHIQPMPATHLPPSHLHSRDVQHVSATFKTGKLGVATFQRDEAHRGEALLLLLAGKLSHHTLHTCTRVTAGKEANSNAPLPTHHTHITHSNIGQSEHARDEAGAKVIISEGRLVKLRHERFQLVHAGLLPRCPPHPLLHLQPMRTGKLQIRPALIEIDTPPTRTARVSRCQRG
mmetsp:Transcript_11883/g.32146  ORF Transcript_11883/g.32146 Transcript_11883/m.32146 type:complete len:257 (+) Transcript_11883:401-1171(+)